MIRKVNLWNRFFSKLYPYDPVKEIRKNGFWFVDVPRTSSTSIKMELADMYGVAYGKRNVLEPGYGTKSYFRGHLTAQEAKALLTEDLWSELFKFTMVRNPWDRMVSLYCFRLKREHFSPTLTFKDYILQLKSPRYRAAGAMHSGPAFYYGAAEYVLDKQDNLMVDYIGKYETRETSIRAISQRINYPQLGELCLQKAKPSERHYSSYYDSETRKLIADVYAKDIELFDYEFEG